MTKLAKTKIQKERFQKARRNYEKLENGNGNLKSKIYWKKVH